jgi:hypothetical protein
MDFARHAAIVLSVALFLHYGVSCLSSSGMVSDFERFGLSRYRKLTGSLEVVGALGLLAGYFYSPFVVVAAAGLALLMALGIAVRIRIRDSLVDMLPAITLLLVNLFILFAALARPR